MPAYLKAILCIGIIGALFMILPALLVIAVLILL